jgi:fructose-bisphosphate aldolase class II
MTTKRCSTSPIREASRSGRSTSTTWSWHRRSSTPASRRSSPAILQISKGARKYANIRYLKHIIDAAVEENPGLPLAVHCDHGDTIDLIKTCINDGYTSVMIDGSHHPYDENVKLTAEAVKVAHAAGVVVEAELGMLGGIEEDVVGLNAEEYEKNVEKFLTDPNEAADFRKRTASTASRSRSARRTGLTSSSTRPSSRSTASSRS